MPYQPASTFITQYVDTNGVPLSNGTITALAAGTINPVTMYSDNSGTAIGSIITLNARGEPEVSGNTVMIWLDDSVTYKFVLKDKNGVAIWTVDDINIARIGGDSGALGSLTVTDTLTVSGAIDVGPDISTVRPFKMGFTAWPYDFTSAAYTWTYDKINQYGDIVAHHFKDGLPWDEAYADDATYPAQVETHITDRVSGTDPGKSVFITIDSLTQNRDQLIGEFGVSGQEPRSAPWDTRDFDSPEVITAYSNYAINVIGRFSNVTHFCYGAEVSELYAVDFAQPGQWDKYLTFSAGVYANIKAAYPAVKVMCSMVLKTPGTAEYTAWIGQFARIANYTDVAGISVYPYAFFLPFTDVRPDELVSNWLTQATAIAPGKPLAITETGWIAENINVITPALTATSTPAIQDQYLQKLLNESIYLDMEFVIWWCIADFDDGWDSTLSAIPEAAASLIWKDIGLYDGDQLARQSLTTWGEWLSRDLADTAKGLVEARDLDVLWHISSGSITNRGNIATDTIQANSGIVGRSFFALSSMTTDEMYTNTIYNFGISTFVGNVTALADFQAVNIAATTLISAPAIFIANDAGTGAGFFDGISAGALTVTNDADTGTAGIDILNVGTIASSGLATLADVSTDNVAANSVNSGTVDATTLTVTGQTFLNLPTSAGASGTLWNDGGIVKVSP